MQLILSSACATLVNQASWVSALYVELSLKFATSRLACILQLTNLVGAAV